MQERDGDVYSWCMERKRGGEKKKVKKVNNNNLISQSCLFKFNLKIWHSFIYCVHRCM